MLGCQVMAKTKQRKLEDKIWKLCKEIIRHRYGNTCYTCGAQGLVGSNWHTGHMIAKGALGAYLKYDLRVLRPQCMRCNIHHGGMGAEFIERMRNEEGDEYVDSILSDRKKLVKAVDHYEKIVKEYESIREEMYSV